MEKPSCLKKHLILLFNQETQQSMLQCFNLFETLNLFVKSEKVKPFPIKVNFTNTNSMFSEINCHIFQ